MIKETKDRLTGLYVQRYFEGRLEEELARAKRYHHDLTVMMFQINFNYFLPDHDIRWIMIYTIFKQFGAIVTKDLRNVDIAGRYGSDMFAIMLPETPIEGGKIVAERIRKDIASYTFSGYGAVPEVHVALDGGIAAAPIHGKTGEELIISARLGLEDAIRKGGNMVIESPRKLYDEITIPAETASINKIELPPEASSVVIPTDNTPNLKINEEKLYDSRETKILKEPVYAEVKSEVNEPKMPLVKEQDPETVIKTITGYTKKKAKKRRR
jgi:diguanylate cyclase (GGDEF)-like protein